MESYLKGRGFKDPVSGDASSFRGLLDPDINNSQNADVKDSTSDITSESTIIYDEKDCPKVEVVSENGQPKSIIVHLPDNRLLEIECHY